MHAVATTAPISETTTQLPTTFTEPTPGLQTMLITTRATGITRLPQSTSMATSTTNQPLTTGAQHSTTVGEIQQTTSGLTTTTELTNHEQATSTAGYTESSIGTGSVATDPMMSTKASEGTSESTQLQLSTDDVQQEEDPISTILILSVVITLVSGIIVVIVCLVVGRCICRMLHHKQRRLDLTSLSLNVPDGKCTTYQHCICQQTYNILKSTIIVCFWPS